MSKMKATFIDQMMNFFLSTFKSSCYKLVDICRVILCGEKKCKIILLIFWMDVTWTYLQKYRRLLRQKLHGCIPTLEKTLSGRADKFLSEFQGIRELNMAEKLKKKHNIVKLIFRAKSKRAKPEGGWLKRKKKGVDKYTRFLTCPNFYSFFTSCPSLPHQLPSLHGW